MRNRTIWILAVALLIVGGAIGSGLVLIKNYHAPVANAHTAVKTVDPTTPPPSSAQTTASKPKPSPKPTPKPTLVTLLAGKVVTIDPGHNGQNGAHPEIINQQVFDGVSMKACNTTGTATNDGYPESAFNFSVAVRLQAILRSEGATVKLTRTSDDGVGPCINTRAQIGNDAHSDAVVSIHGDGVLTPGAVGFHVIEPGVANTPSRAVLGPSDALAKDLIAAYHQGTGEPIANYATPGGLDKRTDLGGLNLSTRPIAMIECGNMRNVDDATRMKDPTFREAAARALAQGLTTFLTH